MIKILKKILLIFIFTSFVFSAFPESTKIENLSKFTLKNGLELYVAENHTVPLVYIEIAVRGGGIAQKKENAGLFHLYEHMMFKGNSKYKTQEEIQNAITNLGVTTWNGTTGTEYVNYFFTVPKAKLAEGLEFWNYAIRTPKMDEREFEAEKKVVLSEIQGDKNEQSKILYKFITEKMFPEEPWAGNPGGTADIVENATIKQLKAIQKEYYIPNNAALFVGGDVNPDEVFELVKRIYGNWKKGKNPWKNNVKEYSKTPLSKTEYYVMPYEKLSENMAQVQVIFRGPDAEFDREDTYAIDMLTLAASNPDGYFAKSLVQNENFAIPDSDYCFLNYVTSRRLGEIKVGAVMLAPDQFLPERAKEFEEEIYNSVSGIFPEDEELSEQYMKSIERLLYNNHVYEQETAQGLLSTTRFWWGCADSDYYFDYMKNVSEVTKNDIERIISKYFADRKSLVIVLVNPSVYERTKDDYIQNGYIEINRSEME